MLTIGASNSGKTVMLFNYMAEKRRQILASCQLKQCSVYVVNGQTLPEGFLPLEWDKVLEVTNCLIIFDDIGQVSDHLVNIMYSAITVRQHHFSVPVIGIVTHNILSSNLSRLLPTITHARIMSESKGSSSSLNRLLQAHFFLRSERQKLVHEFVNANLPRYSYFLLRLKQPRTFTRVLYENGFSSSSGGAKKKSEKKKTVDISEHLKTVTFYLPALAGNVRDRAEIIFQLILKKIPLEKVCVDSLCLSLTDHRLDKSTINISLLDYVSLLLTNTLPSIQMQKLHKRISKRYITLPNCLIVNEHLKRRQ